MRRTLSIVTCLLAASPLAAQAPLALAARTPRLEPMELRSTLTLTLNSDWPQYVASPGCVNGGAESLRGTLTLGRDGRYRGMLTRSATIRFCGSHGPAVGACTLTLTSDGVVPAEGAVRNDSGGQVLDLAWALPQDPMNQQPVGRTAGSTRVEGDCDPEFRASVRRLYLAAAHALEVPLPAAESGHEVRLDDYGWTVEFR